MAPCSAPWPRKRRRGALGKPKGGKGRPPKSFGKGDIGILNYALTLEYLEAAFYAEAKKNNRSGASRPVTRVSSSTRSTVTRQLTSRT